MLMILEIYVHELQTKHIIKNYKKAVLFCSLEQECLIYWDYDMKLLYFIWSFALQEHTQQQFQGSLNTHNKTSEKVSEVNCMVFTLGLCYGWINPILPSNSKGKCRKCWSNCLIWACSSKTVSHKTEKWDGVCVLTWTTTKSGSNKKAELTDPTDEAKSLSLA